MPNYTQEQLEKAVHDVRVLGHSHQSAAKANGVPKSTLLGRLRGKKSSKFSHVAYQRLTQFQERVLVSWIMAQHQTGAAPTQKQIMTLVARLLREQGDHEPLGKQWLARFLDRNEPLKKLPSRGDAGTNLRSVGAEAVEVIFSMMTNPLLMDDQTEKPQLSQGPFHMSQGQLVMTQGYTTVRIIGTENAGVVNPVNLGAVNPVAVNPGAVNPSAVNSGIVRPGMAHPGMVDRMQGQVANNVVNTGNGREKNPIEVDSDGVDSDDDNPDEADLDKPVTSMKISQNPTQTNANEKSPSRIPEQ
ncbi:putative transposase [Fusarium flagelliforme]|uniref:Putative transposase n=1 Tax=Fusarium flagelliforme TaxID=2675880 RepID=A0A395M6D2_9HYPO|nr:putative transposase [Fusarium flagelliforme]